MSDLIRDSLTWEGHLVIYAVFFYVNVVWRHILVTLQLSQTLCYLPLSLQGWCQAWLRSSRPRNATISASPELPGQTAQLYRPTHRWRQLTEKEGCQGGGKSYHTGEFHELSLSISAFVLIFKFKLYFFTALSKANRLGTKVLHKNTHNVYT